jgi:hypothetical protein
MFPQRLFGDQRFELSHHPGAAAGFEVGVDPLLPRAQPQLLEAGYVTLERGLVDEIGQGRPAPERKSLRQLARTLLGGQRFGVGNEALELS